MHSLRNRNLILGSTSVYRRELLGRLRLPFSVESPHVDESALPGEAPAALAQRLALAKAQELMTRHNIDSALLRMERGESGGAGGAVVGPVELEAAHGNPRCAAMRGGCRLAPG